VIGADRVTREGEFSPTGQLFTSYVQLFENLSNANFWYFFPTEKVMHCFLQNIAWDTFWAIFSQTHLVTLLEPLARSHIEKTALKTALKKIERKILRKRQMF
jgi:hypothetical protein